MAYIFKTPFEYVMPNYANSIVDRLACWQKCFVASDFPKDHVSEIHFESSLNIFYPILYMDGFSLIALYFNGTVSGPYLQPKQKYGYIKIQRQ